MRASGALVAVAMFVMLPARAWADGAADAREADALYEQAAKLIKEGRYAEACPTLERSERLDPGLGTEFHLADCYEHVGRLGSAYVLFRGVASAARAADKQKLLRLAEDRQKQLVGRVPRIVVTFASPETNADVFVDGVRASSNDWGREGVPTDPGRREVEVRAYGKLPWHATATPREGEVVSLRVEALAPIAAATAPTSDAAKPPRSVIRPIGLVTAGVGLVVTIVGGVAGVVALQRRNDARDACGSDDPRQCRSESAVGQWGDALTAANVSTISLVAGGILVGAGGALWFLGAPSGPKVTARASAHGGGVGLEGAF